jgi:hypothetical protein
MLKRPNPTLSPSRFNSKNIKNLLETVQSVANRSLLNEFGIAGGPQTSTGSASDPLLDFQRKKRPLGGLEVPGSDVEQEMPEQEAQGEEARTTGFGSGNQTSPTRTSSGTPATLLGSAPKGYRGTKSGFEPSSFAGQSNMNAFKSGLGSKAGQFGNVGGKPNPGMDYSAGAYYMVTEPMVQATAAKTGAALASGLEALGAGTGTLGRALGAAATAAGVDALADPIGQATGTKPTSVTQKPSTRPPKPLR